MKRINTRAAVVIFAVLALVLPAFSTHTIAYCGPDANGDIYCDGTRVVSDPLPVAFTEFVDEFWTPIDPKLYRQPSVLVVDTPAYQATTDTGKVWHFTFSSPPLDTDSYYFSLTDASYPIPNVEFGEPYRLDLIVDRSPPKKPEIVSGYNAWMNGVYYFNYRPAPVVSAEAASSMTVYVDGEPTQQQLAFPGSYDPVSPRLEEYAVPVDASPDELHKVRFESSDMVGNSDYSEYYIFWDSLTPSVSFFPGDNAVVGSSRPQLRFDMVDEGSGIDSDSIHIEVSNSQLTLVCDYPESCSDFDYFLDHDTLFLTPKQDLSVSDRTEVDVSVSVSDFAGNSVQNDYSFVIDTNTPYITDFTVGGGINYPLGPYTPNSAPSLDVVFDSDASLSSYSLVPSGNLEITEAIPTRISFATSSLQDGRYYLQLKASRVLESGGLGPEATLEKQFIVDTISPSITITSPSATVPDVYTLEADIVEKNIDSVKIFVNDKLVDELHSIPGYDSDSGSGKLVYLLNLSMNGSEGYNNVLVRVNDLAGHQSSDSVMVVLDSENPYIRNVVPGQDSVVSTSPVTFTGEAEYNSKVELYKGILLAGSAIVKESEEFDVLIEGTSFSPSSLSVPYDSTITITNSNPPGSIPVRFTYNSESALLDGGESVQITPVSGFSTAFVQSTANPNLNDTLNITSRQPDDSFTIENVELSPSSWNYIHFVVTDLAGRQTSYDEKIYYDNSPPEVAFNSPMDGLAVSTHELTVSASLSDDYALDHSSAKLYIDGGEIDPGLYSYEVIDDSHAKISYTAAFAEGQHTARIEASDAAGNHVSSSVSFTIDNRLPSAPVVSVPGFEPLSDSASSFSLGTLTFDFKLLYDEPVVLREHSSSLDGTYWLVSSGDGDLKDREFTFRAELNSLPPPDDFASVSFDARLKDVEGSAWGSSAVLNFQGDFEPPSIQLDYPSSTSSPRVTVHVSWSDAHMRSVSFSGDIVSQSSIPELSGTGGSFDVVLTLKNQDSDNVITLSAVDYANNQVTKQISIFWDNTPPDTLELYPVDSPTGSNYITVAGFTNPDAEYVTVSVYRSDKVGDVSYNNTTYNINPESAELGSLTFRNKLSPVELSFEEDSCTGLAGNYLQKEPFSPEIGRWLIQSCSEEGVVDKYIILTLSSQIPDDISFASGEKLTYHSLPLPSGYFEVPVKLEEGMNYIFARAYDSAGSSVETGSFMPVLVDSRQPDISGLQPSEGAVLNGNSVIISAFIDGTGTNISDYRMKLDDNTVDAVLSPAAAASSDYAYFLSYSTSNLPDGQHSVWISAADEAGNENSRFWSFTVDSSAPSQMEFSVTDGISRGSNTEWYLNSENAEIFMTFAEGETINILSMSFDGNSVSDYEQLSPNRFRYSTSVSDGTHTLIVSASKWVDDLSDWGTPVTYELTLHVDSTPPSILSIAPEEVVTAVNPVEISIQLSEKGICRYSTSDTAGFESMQPVTVSSSDANKLVIDAPLGTTTYYFRCSDLAGNLAPELAVSTVTFDNVTPPLNVTYEPAGLLIPGCTLSVSGTSEYGATITLDVLGHEPMVQKIEEKTSYGVSIEAGFFSPGTLAVPEGSSVTFTNNDELHSYVVSERYGNLRSLTLAPFESATYRLGSGTYTFDLMLESQDVVLDTLIVETSPLPDTFNFGPVHLLYPSPQPNAVRISAEDGAGNKKVLDYRYVVCDDQNPVAELLSPDGKTAEQRPLITFSLSDEYSLNEHSIRLWIDGEEVTDFSYDPDTSTLSYQPPYPLIGSGQVEKEVPVKLYAEDDAGNSVSVEDSFTIDTRQPLPPVFLIDGRESSYATTDRPLITVDFRGQKVSISDAYFVNNPSRRLELVSNFADQVFIYRPVDPLESTSSYEFAVVASLLDSGGSQNSYSTTFTVDVNPPSVSITTPSHTTRSQSVVIAGTCSDDMAVSKVVIQQQGNIPVEVPCRSGSFSSSYTLLPARNSEYSLPVTATAFDAAGLSSSDEVAITLDRKPPVLSLQASPLPASSEVTLTVKSSEELSSLPSATVTLPSGMQEDISCSQSDSPLAFECSYNPPEGISGSVLFSVSASDPVGNTAEASLSVPVDTSAPVVSSFSPRLSTSNQYSLVEIFYSGSSGRSFDSIDTDSVSFEFDGKSIPPDSENLVVTPSRLTFSPASPLSEGEHSVKVSLGDSAGNSVTRSWSFVVNTAFPEDPAISLDSSLRGPDGVIYTSSADNLLSITFPDTYSESSLNLVSVSILSDSGTLVADITSSCTPSLVSGALSFDCPVSLEDQASYLVRIEASLNTPSGPGPSAVYEVPVVVDSQPPSISVNDLPRKTSERELSLSGTVSDPFLREIHISGMSSSVPEQIMPASSVSGTHNFDYSLGLAQQSGELQNGPRVFRLSASDMAGNIAELFLTTEIDTSKPELFVDSLPDYTSHSSVSVSGLASVGSEVFIEAPSSDYSSSVVVDTPTEPGGNLGRFEFASVPLQEGPNDIILHASYASSGASSGISSHLVTRDSSPPSAVFMSPSGAVSNPFEQLRFGLVDSGSGVASAELVVDGETFTLDSSALTLKRAGSDSLADYELVFNPAEASLASLSFQYGFFEGTHSVTVSVTDMAGLSSSKDYSFTLLPSSPSLLEDISGKVYNTQTPSLTFSFSEPVEVVHADIDGNENAVLSSDDSKTFTVTPSWNLDELPSLHSLNIEARSLSSGESFAFGPLVFGVDVSPPALTLNPPVASAGSGAVIISGVVDDADLERIEFSGSVEDAQPVLNPSSNYFAVPVKLSGSGPGVVTVTAYDKFSSETESVSVEGNSPPVSASVSVTPNPASEGSLVFSASVQGGESKPPYRIYFGNNKLCESYERSFTCKTILDSSFWLNADYAGAVSSAGISKDVDVKLKDSSQTLSSALSSADAAPPFIPSVSPAPHSRIGSPDMPVRAYISDPPFASKGSSYDSGMDAGSVSVSINGHAPGFFNAVLDVSDSAVTITPSTGWPDGKYHVTLRAADRAGNKIMKEWSFSVSSSLPPEPKVFISNSQNHDGVFYTRDSSPAVSVSMDDYNDYYDISKVAVYRYVNGNPASLVSDITSSCSKSRIAEVWSCSMPELDSESSYVLLVSLLPAGMEDSERIATYYYPFVVDSHDPVLSVSAGRPVTASRRLELSGFYMDFSMDSVSISGDISEGTLTIPLAPSSVERPFSAEVTLTGGDGQKQIVVTALDRAGRASTKTLSVTLDTSKPALTLTSPDVSSGAYYTSSPYLSVSGTSDPGASVVLADLSTGVSQSSVVGGQRLDYSVSVSNASFRISGGSASDDSLTVPVSSTVRFVQEDAYVSYSVSVTEQNSGSVMPSFVLSGAGSSHDVSFDRPGIYVFKLESSDVPGLVLSTLTINVNVPRNTFSIENMPLSEGPNLMRLVAEDGLTGEMSDAISFVAVYDSEKPVVDLLSPTGTIADSSPVISARVYDDASGLKDVRLFIDGAEVSPGDFSYEANRVSFTPDSLDDGMHTVRIFASDRAGLSSEVSWSFSVDSSLPDLLESPGSRVFSSSTPQLVVRFSDAVILSGFSVDSGTSPVSLSQGSQRSFTFVPDAPLSDGSHTVVFAASKDLGESQGVTGLYGPFEFFIDTKSPIISLSADSRSTSDRNVTLTLESDESLASISVTGDVESSPVDLYANLMKKFFIPVTLTEGSGVKTVSVKAYDYAGNPSNVASIKILFDIDGPAPLSVNVSANDTPAPSITLFFGEPVTITSYSLVDSSLNRKPVSLSVSQDSESAVFSASDLRNGRYTLVVTASDSLGNERTSEVAFSVRIAPLGLSLLSPRFGYSSVPVFNAVFSTDRDASCKYNFGSPVSYEAMPYSMSDDGVTHTIKDLSLEESSVVSVWAACVDDYGLVWGPYPFTFTLDMTPPVITSAYADPSTVTTESFTDGSWKRIVDIYARADEPVVCKLSNETLNYTEMEFEFDNYNPYSEFSFSTELHAEIDTLPTYVADYTYYVVCENRAGLFSQPFPVQFSVNLYLALQIQPLNPVDGFVTQDSSVVLNISTNKPQSICSYSLDNSQKNPLTPFENGRIHSARIPLLSEGRHSIKYRCSYFTENAEAVVNLVRDITPPSTPVVNPQNFTCFPDELFASWSSDDDLSGIDHYEYAIGSYMGYSDVKNWTKAGSDRKRSALAEDLNLTDKTTYYWSVRAVDRAGLVSQPGYADVFVDFDDPRCKEQVPPTVSVSKTVVQAGLEVSLDCSDSDSGCNPDAFFYGLSLPGSDCAPYEAYLSPPILDQDYIICWYAEDFAGNVNEGSEFINYSELVNDTDMDSVPDQFDNCPDVFNPDQSDFNFNGVGDACESFELNESETILSDGSNSDLDKDGIIDAEDDDIDGDGILNWEDGDDDNDGLCDSDRQSSEVNVSTCVGSDNDDDEDGVLDKNERDTNNDLDNDGISNGQDADLDGDGVLDCSLNLSDSDDDNDGVLDWLDSDDDNDYIPDVNDADFGGSDENCAYSVNDSSTFSCRSASNDLDADGTPNDEDRDIDGDGVLNWEDNDTDNDGVVDFCDVDDDNDGVVDSEDLDSNNDLDNDGIINEADDDVDGDGILNADDSDDDNDGIPDDIDEDDDNDGIPDSDEILDSDGDGMPDKWEMAHGLNPYEDDSMVDADNDLLTNIEEYKKKTDPRLEDTDGDSYGDGVELADGFDPLDPESYPKSNIWSLLLLVIAAVIILGGGSYVGVTQYKKKKGRGRSPPSVRSGRPPVVQRPSRSPVSPRTSAPVGRRQAAAPGSTSGLAPSVRKPLRRRSLSPIEKRRMEQKEKERLRVFEEFDEGKKDIRPLEEAKPKKRVASEKPKEDKDWIPIDKLLSGKKKPEEKLASVIDARNLHEHLKPVLNLPSSASRKDVFAELSRRVDSGKISDDTFRKLDEISKIGSPSRKRSELSKVLSGISSGDVFESMEKSTGKLSKKKQSKK